MYVTGYDLAKAEADRIRKIREEIQGIHGRLLKKVAEADRVKILDRLRRSEESARTALLELVKVGKDAAEWKSPGKTALTLKSETWTAVNAFVDMYVSPTGSK